MSGPGYLGPAFGPFVIEGDPSQGDIRSHGATLPDEFSLRDLEARESLRDRFDRGLRAIELSDAMAGLDRFHRQAAEILTSDRIRSALDLARENGLSLPFTRTMLGDMAQAMERGWGGRDARIALSLQEERAGVSVRIADDSLKDALR